MSEDITFPAADPAGTFESIDRELQEQSRIGEAYFANPSDATARRHYMDRLRENAAGVRRAAADPELGAACPSLRRNAELQEQLADAVGNPAREAELRAELAASIRHVMTELRSCPDGMDRFNRLTQQHHAAQPGTVRQGYHLRSQADPRGAPATTRTVLAEVDIALDDMEREARTVVGTYNASPNDPAARRQYVDYLRQNAAFVRLAADDPELGTACPSLRRNAELQEQLIQAVGTPVREAELRTELATNLRQVMTELRSCPDGMDRYARFAERNRHNPTVQRLGFITTAHIAVADGSTFWGIGESPVIPSGPAAPGVVHSTTPAHRAIAAREVGAVHVPDVPHRPALRLPSEAVLDAAVAASVPMMPSRGGRGL